MKSDAHCTTRAQNSNIDDFPGHPQNSLFVPYYRSLSGFSRHRRFVAILKSKKSVRNIEVEISCLLWVEDYAASCDVLDQVCPGVIDRWQDNSKTVLMIRWKGYNRCQAVPLSTLDKAANGESLGFTLLPDKNGNAITRDFEAAAPPPPPPAVDSGDARLTG